MYKKPTKRILGMTQTEVLIFITLGGLLLCVFILFGVYIIYNLYRPNLVAVQPPTLLSQPTQPSIPTVVTNSEPIQNHRIWVIYEVIFVGNQFPSNPYAAESLSITWVNNTGGTNQADHLTGDGTRHIHLDPNGGGDTNNVKPFRYAYTMQLGDFAYISAQNGDSNEGQLFCNIYISDAEGEHCLVEQGRICGGTIKWKQAECNGDYCICTASGFVGDR